MCFLSILLFGNNGYICAYIYLIYNKLADYGMNQEKCLITRIKSKC